MYSYTLTNMQAPTKAGRQRNKLQAKKRKKNQKPDKSNSPNTNFTNLLIKVFHITLKYDSKIKHKHKYQMALFEVASQESENLLLWGLFCLLLLFR